MSAPISSTTRFRHAPDAAWRVVDDQAVVITSATQKMRVLNGVGTRVWQECEGKTFGELVTLLQGEYDADPARIEEDARQFVEDLIGRGMIERIDP